MKLNHLNHAFSMPCLAASSDDESASNFSTTSSDRDSPVLHRATTTLHLDQCAEVETAIAPHIGYKKVLVTGGAGFIGSHVARFLLDRGDDEVVIDELNE